MGGGGVGQGVGVAVGVAGEEVDAAVGVSVVVDGQEERAQGVRAESEGVVAGGEDVVEAGVGEVEFGDGDGAGDAFGGAFAPQGAGGGGDRVGGGDDEDGGVGGVQGGAQVGGEVGVAGRVDQVDLDALPFEREERELDGALLLVLDVLVVGDGGAVGDAAARPVAPAARARDSARVVLPTPLGPMRTTLRRSFGPVTAGAWPARAVLRSGIGVSSRGAEACPSQSRVGCRSGACRTADR